MQTLEDGSSIHNLSSWAPSPSRSMSKDPTEESVPLTVDPLLHIESDSVPRSGPDLDLEQDEGDEGNTENVILTPRQKSPAKKR